MEIVCLDAGNSVWKYRPDDNCYYRHYQDGTFRKIKAEFIPDPDELLKAKIEAVERVCGVVNIELLRPSPAIYALWKHKSGLSHG